MPLHFVKENLEDKVKFKYHKIIRKLPSMSNIDGRNPLQKIMLAEALAKHIRWNAGIMKLKGVINQANQEFHDFDIPALVKKIMALCKNKPKNVKEFIFALTIYGTSYYGLGKTIGEILMKEQQNTKKAKAKVNPIRQRTQYTCMSASLMMCLMALGHDELDEDTVNHVMGATPMHGAAWENVIAAAQHFGFRTVMVTPCTIPQLKKWTDQGIPVMIAWNPEGRDWSHASVVFDVDADGNVHVADPNIPDPEETVRIVPKAEFYKKWFEKWPDYLVRKPACAVMMEITPDGKQVLATSDPNPLCNIESPIDKNLCPKDKGKDAIRISDEDIEKLGSRWTEWRK